MNRKYGSLWTSLVLAGLMAGLGAAGCRSTDPQAPRFPSLASVSLHGVTPAEIRQATLDVFKDNLYSVAYAGTDNFVFEKPGSWMKDLAYGTWFNSSVWTRVRVDLIPYGTNSHLLACNAHLVRDRGDSLFEEEQKILKTSKRPYQKLLNQVKERLESDSEK